MLVTRPSEPSDRSWIEDLLQRHWGSARIVTRGHIYEATKLPAFIALLDDKRVGLLTYQIAGTDCEIVSLISEVERRGIGTALVESLTQRAAAAGCHRVWLITTNDNLSALRFWQKRGFTLVAVHRGAIENSRKLKPEIPLLGENDIPIRDEIELEWLL